MSPLEGSGLLVAAAAAGTINAIAGGGTVITFPALLALGLDPIVANATNTVALAPGGIATVWVLRRELAAATPWLRMLVPLTLAGGLAGAVLLLRTPSATFAAIVPFLILFATGLIGCQTPIQRWVRPRGAREPTPAWRPGLVAYQVGLGVYGGYFGAGFGIMMLAGLGLLGLTDIRRMIVLRNVCGLAANGIAALYFVAGTAVSWPHVVVMVVGQVVGGYGGARLAQRLSPTTIRRAVVVIGAAIGIWLLAGWRP